jgi:hypothetical protein
MPTDPTPLSYASTLAIELLRPVVYAAGAALATWGASWFYRKTKVDISKTLTIVVDLAIGYAEQMAFRRGLGALTDDEKKQTAVEYARKLCKDRRLPGWACDEVANMIEAKLGLEKRAAKVAGGNITALMDETPLPGAPGQPLSTRG